MTPFQLTKIENTDDGRIYCEWITVADDEGRLEEGTYLTPSQGESVGDCVRREITRIKEKRDQLNTKPKERRQAPGRSPAEGAEVLMSELSRP